MANETTLETKITEADNSQIAGNTKTPETEPTNTKVQNTDTNKPNDSKDNTITEKLAEVEALDKRIEMRLAQIEKLNKVDVGGESTVEQTLTKEQKITNDCNKFLEGTGLKI